jgi:hypothetical protein
VEHNLIKQQTNKIKKRRPFEGDATHRLPAGAREPYRLWYGFLRLAHRDPTLRGKINKSFYAAWGDVTSTPFDKWFESNWRDLFGVPLRVVRVSPDDQDTIDALGRNRLFVSIDITASLEATLKELKAVIRSVNKIKRTKSRVSKTVGRFSLTGATELKRLNAQQALKVYELSLNHDDLDTIVTRYLEWVDAWNKKIEEKKWKRGKIVPPSAFRSYASDMKMEQRKLDDTRRSIRRLLQRARKIAVNVAGGEFPGRY